MKGQLGRESALVTGRPIWPFLETWVVSACNKARQFGVCIRAPDF